MTGLNMGCLSVLRHMLKNRYSSAFAWAGVLTSIVTVCLCALPVTAVAADTSLVYVTPRGVTFTVTEKGLSTIRKGFGAVVDGEWTAFNAESRFKDAGSNQVQIPSPTEKTLTVINPKQAQVRHVGGDVVCTYDYTFNDEDVLISCRFENNHATAPINVIGFSGLTFHFARPPEGVLPVESDAYFQEHGLSVCHPSTFSPIGGSYAADKDVGVGVSPMNTHLFRTLLLWDYANWDANERDRVLERKLNYIANSPVPAGGAVTLGLALRVSPDMSWQHLLQPYRDAFQKLHGPVQYKTDGRWMAIENLAEAEKATTSRRTDETRRMNASRRPGDDVEGTSRRSSGKGLDSSRGAQAVCDSLIPRLTEANGQGAILWGHGVVDGVDETGLSEFNVLSPDVEDQWERVTEQFAAAQLKFGVATSPNQISVRTSWKEHSFIQLNPNDPGHRELLWSRYDQMVQRGCRLFFLDHFGGTLEDAVLMRWLREKMGADVQTFADQPSDVMLVYSAGYSPAILKTGSAAGLERGYQLQLGEKNWEIIRWLVPGCELGGQLTEIKGNLNDALESPERYFYTRGIVPFLTITDFKRVPAIKKLQPQFVEEDGQRLPSKTTN